MTNLTNASAIRSLFIILSVTFFPHLSSSSSVNTHNEKRIVIPSSVSWRNKNAPRRRYKRSVCFANGRQKKSSRPRRHERPPFSFPVEKPPHRHPSDQILLHSITTDREENSRSARPTVHNDRRNVLLHLLSCTATAVTICLAEEYDCNNLKPEAATLRPRAVRGLGSGRAERMEDEFVLARDVPSYNEVMLAHRETTVPGWRRHGNDGMKGGGEGAAVRIASATGVLFDAFDGMSRLKKMSEDYDWEGVKSLLESSLFQRDLNDAFDVLRNELKREGKEDAAMEIGFDWGSCAWRHCGAYADAQESIAELRNSLGMLEPFECMFVLDIIERSIRDAIVVVPAKYHPRGRKLPEYLPYQSTPEGQEDEDDGYSKIETNFLSALKLLRNNDL